MTQVFFAYPYNFEDEYRRLVIRACQDLNVTAIFGDGSVGSGALVEKMVSSIERADAALFDITGFNPNVMMELGIAYQHKRKIYFMYDEPKHRSSPLVKQLKEMVPANIKGQDHFIYKNLGEFDTGVRKGLRDILGVDRNSLFDIKSKIDRALRTGPQRIGDITKTIGATDRNQVEQALMVLRAENRVQCKGHGLGARWELRTH